LEDRVTIRDDQEAQWAAADEIVDQLVETLRHQPMTDSQAAMALLALEHPQRMMLLAMIAAIALQRIAK
jgi:hypothetical protein